MNKNAIKLLLLQKQFARETNDNLWGYTTMDSRTFTTQVMVKLSAQRGLP
jgi:hypothetical protein